MTEEQGKLPIWASSKTTDTVSHRMLKDKLLMLRLNKQRVGWSENCLSGWAQRVVITGNSAGYIKLGVADTLGSCAAI